MGLSVILQDERCKVILRVCDPGNLLHRVLPLPEDASFPLLRYVDWYGDAVFNRLQVPELLIELDRLVNRAGSEGERGILHQVRDLAARCEREPHLYLKFEGD